MEKRETNHMCLMLTPHSNVCMLPAAEKSHLVTLTKDEYVGSGSYRVMRKAVIQLSLSEYYLVKSAFGAVEAEFWIKYVSRVRDPVDKVFHYEKENTTHQLFKQEAPSCDKIKKGYYSSPKEVEQTVSRQ